MAKPMYKRCLCRTGSGTVVFDTAMQCRVHHPLGDDDLVQFVHDDGQLNPTRYRVRQVTQGQEWVYLQAPDGDLLSEHHTTRLWLVRKAAPYQVRRRPDAWYKWVVTTPTGFDAYRDHATAMAWAHSQAVMDSAMAEQP